MFVYMAGAIIAGLAFAIPTLIHDWRFAISQPIWYIFLLLDGTLGVLMGGLVKISFKP